ncbi:E2 ubiquitin-conjugating protein RAD6 [Aspergillus nidulans FGSC A4]|uniref:E2 ubiquitin-conjugating protein RAD6 n=1 Tax=Emericella nidulans (strain FGSC A4 / ATCC 38163 / CBS 112.46 / NRRL 194 / M139) TaxID=227321 RepID=UPI0001B78448|nr:E2 ubiquitin-conjugating protein RAD6 [Aspergillus nidulans FGSC A4]CBF82065.1 TPA: hypothetical protein similar to UVSJ (Eurofung) [Aspergillus nidulans FGSC A4]
MSTSARRRLMRDFKVRTFASILAPSLPVLCISLYSLPILHSRPNQISRCWTLSANRFLQRQRMQTDPPAGVSASPVADNVMTWSLGTPLLLVPPIPRLRMAHSGWSCISRNNTQTSLPASSSSARCSIPTSTAQESSVSISFKTAGVPLMMSQRSSPVSRGKCLLNGLGYSCCILNTNCFLAQSVYSMIQTHLLLPTWKRQTFTGTTGRSTLNESGRQWRRVGRSRLASRHDCNAMSLLGRRGLPTL